MTLWANCWTLIKSTGERSWPENTRAKKKGEES